MCYLALCIAVWEVGHSGSNFLRESPTLRHQPQSIHSQSPLIGEQETLKDIYIFTMLK